MKQFFIKLGDNSIYQTLMKEPLTYVAGAVMLSVLQISHFVVLGSTWGVTSAFADWGAWVYNAFGGDVSTWAYFSTEAEQKALASGFLKHGASLRDLGIIFGAMVATLFASQFKFKMIKSKRQIVAAVLGGLLMGYGARLANGCNIGNLFSGTAGLALSGWVFAAFLLVGAYIGGKLLTKYFI